MSVDLHSFAVETLFWTGVLIVAVLALRRPVSRQFGARAAYALWLLPFLRLVLPPIVLPAWLAPEAVQVPGAASAAAATSAAAAPAASTTPLPLPIGDFSLADTSGGGMMLQPIVASEPAIDWVSLALAVWLVGALVFLARRYSLYFAMRRELLLDSIEVGTRGRVRLIESPATASPVAFGVFDKVVALPEGFMAHTQPARRDLALEHELAHHRAHDLLANALVQPLFALHWFNPLCWVGWRAMRRDQEAACDARVVARCDARLRETYAATIASFATRSDRRASLALAAPMACPVLGDKSIIHRLRSLTMSDISPRRRMAARALMLGALVALPLTASITYAETLIAADAPTAPAAPQAPAAPSAPDAPEAPSAPLAPEAPDSPQISVISTGKDGEDRVIRIEREVVKDDSGKATERTSYTVNGREATAEERAEIERQIERLTETSTEADRMRGALPEVRARVAKAEKQREKLMNEAEQQRVEAEDMRRVLAERGKIEEEMRVAILRANEDVRRLRVDCDGSGDLVKEWLGSDGEAAPVFCTEAGLASARHAIEEARREIARDRDLPRRARAEALRSLDAVLRGLETAD